MNNNYLELYNQAIQITTNEIKTQAITEAVNKTVEILNEYKKDLSIVKKDYEIIKKDNEETKLKLDNTIKNLNDTKEEYKKLKDVTYVLATDDGKMKELTRLMQSLTYKKCTKTKNSLKDKLFHKSITDTCYKHLYNQFQINSYKRIHIDDFEESLKVIKRWFGNEQNIKRTINKKLQEYRNDKHLSIEKQNMVDKYLELTNGGNNIEI